MFKPPEYSDWQASVMGGFFIFRPMKGKEPHAFWRMMQFLILGIRWTHAPQQSTGV